MRHGRHASGPASRAVDSIRPVRWTAIVNPAAGRGRGRRLLPRLADVLAAAPVEVAVEVSAGPADPARLARAAFARGDGVVVCGGDGLVSEVAGPAVEAGGLVAVVPTGSGNDFARALGLDHRHPLRAVAGLADGREVCVDLGRARSVDAPGEGRWFATVAGTGFDAEANRWANTVRHLSGTPLYVAAVLRTLVAYRPRRFRLTVDGGAPYDVDAWLVAVANGASYGGGMRITPDARLDDATLDVCVVGPTSKADFVRTFPRVFRGTHVTHPAVSFDRGTVVRVEALPDRSPLPPPELYASGERVGPLPAEVRVVAGALRVWIPAGSPLSRR